MTVTRFMPWISMQTVELSLGQTVKNVNAGTGRERSRTGRFDDDPLPDVDGAQHGAQGVKLPQE